MDICYTGQTTEKACLIFSCSQEWMAILMKMPSDKSCVLQAMGGGLGGVAVRVHATNLWGRRFESRAGRFMLESW